MRTTINDIQKRKNIGVKIPMVTAYDYTGGKLVSKAGIPLILVGDSLGQVILGHDSTIPVTMDDMVRHTQMVVRGTDTQHIVSDMPFMSYQVDIEKALNNAGRLVKEGGCQSVKLEGGVRVLQTVKNIVDAGIPVMGHLGLLPQTAEKYSVQGKTTERAIELIQDAKILEESGVFSIVLEMVASDVATIITKTMNVPTIGIGSGKDCDGQVLVTDDLIGLNNTTIRFVKKFVNIKKYINLGLKKFSKEVRSKKYPTKKYSY